MSIKAKKRYGQHFLKSDQTAAQIVNLLDEDGLDLIVEVGPGKGMLTQYLLDRKAPLYLIEADRDMVIILKDRFDPSHMSIIQEDFLKTNLSRLTNEKNQIGIIGNFPYNISSQIIFKCLEAVEIIPQLVGMFQLEMAKRIIAHHGNKDYGIISVLTQIYYRGEIMFRLKGDEFSPPPKVESAVLKLKRKNISSHIDDMIFFKRVVKQTFGQRRKMIRNTLKVLLPNEYDTSSEFFNKRPEQISVEEFIQLANQISQAISKLKKE